MGRQVRSGSTRTGLKISRTSLMLKMTGRVFSRGGRTNVRVVYALVRVCAKNNLRPHSALVVALRAYGLTCFR